SVGSNRTTSHSTRQSAGVDWANTIHGNKKAPNFRWYSSCTFETDIHLPIVFGLTKHDQRSFPPAHILAYERNVIRDEIVERIAQGNFPGVGVIFQQTKISSAVIGGNDLELDF